MIFLLSTAVQLPGEEYYAAAHMDHPPLSPALYCCQLRYIIAISKG